MSLEQALAKAREELENTNPRLIAARSGASYDEGRRPELVEGQFRFPFFNRRFTISFPEAQVVEEGSDQAPPQWLEVMILHYLLSARGYPRADRWVPYRALPRANVFGVGFGEGPLRDLVAVFGRNLEGFHQACQALGGTFMDRFGDAAYRFLAFPKIALAVILYLADEEMPASVNLLYDAGCAQHLPTEDLQVLGGYLNSSLVRLALRPSPLGKDQDALLRSRPPRIGLPPPLRGPPLPQTSHPSRPC